MNYEEEKHAERLLADGWLSNDLAHHLKSKLAKAEAQLTALQQASEGRERDAEWQPIETAPKDGRTIQLGKVGREHVYSAQWELEPGWAWKGVSPCWAVYMADDDYYSFYLDAEWPTHWKPLPAPPALSIAGEGKNATV